VVGYAGRGPGFDLEGDPNIGSYQSDEVGDDLFRDAGGVAADPLRVEGHTAVEARGWGRAWQR
jgi:hypothetical protein